LFGDYIPPCGRGIPRRSPEDLLPLVPIPCPAAPQALRVAVVTVKDATEDIVHFLAGIEQS